MALLELNPELERLVLWFEMEDKSLWPLRTCLFFPPFPPSFIPREAALQNSLKHLQHFFLSRLARNLQQQRLRADAMLDTFLAQAFRNISQRKCLGHGRPRTSNFLCDIFMRVFKLRGQTM